MIQKNNSESSHSPPEEKYATVSKQIKDLTWFDTKRLLADSADYFTQGQITLTQTTDSLDYTVCLLLIRHLLAENNLSLRYAICLSMKSKIIRQHKFSFYYVFFL